MILPRKGIGKNFIKFKKFGNFSSVFESSEVLEIFQWHRNEDIDEKIKKTRFKKKISEEVC